MAAPWLRTTHVILLIGALCCISFSHGRIITTETRLLNSRVAVSNCTLRTSREAQNSFPGRGEFVSRVGDANLALHPEDHSFSVKSGKKWERTLSKVAEWVLHVCVVLLAIFVAFYAVSCLCACCIGLDLLAEIWRSLGGCGALRALLGCLVGTEKAAVDGDAEAAPLLAGSPE